MYKAMLGCGVQPDICTFVALFQVDHTLTAQQPCVWSHTGPPFTVVWCLSGRESSDGKSVMIGSTCWMPLPSPYGHTASVSRLHWRALGAALC